MAVHLRQTACGFFRAIEQMRAFLRKRNVGKSGIFGGILIAEREKYLEIYPHRFCRMWYIIVHCKPELVHNEKEHSDWVLAWSIFSLLTVNIDRSRTNFPDLYFRVWDTEKRCGNTSSPRLSFQQFYGNKEIKFSFLQ